jgi:hypothetical protein
VHLADEHDHLADVDHNLADEHDVIQLDFDKPDYHQADHDQADWSRLRSGW